MRSITIAGAGLAGLTLGTALQRAGVATTIHEAGSLPRPRVCGEFLCGRGADVLRKLGLGESLRDGVRHRRVRWYLRGRRILDSALPESACGISRRLLDRRLAAAYGRGGGRLIERSRLPERTAGEGTVLCSGRRAAKSDWIGLKLHCVKLETQADLELHLGDNGYLGLSAVEHGRVNVCALFRRRKGLKAAREDCMLAYLEACGLADVAGRIRAGDVDTGSHAGVSGILYARMPAPRDNLLRLGDAGGVIPPFTGNGMSIALESAEIALPELVAYAKGERDWSGVTATIRRACEDRFARRLRSARLLHPWISRPAGQRTLALLNRLHLLPFRLLFSWTH